MEKRLWQCMRPPTWRRSSPPKPCGNILRLRSSSCRSPPEPNFASDHPIRRQCVVTTETGKAEWRLGAASSQVLRRGTGAYSNLLWERVLAGIVRLLELTFSRRQQRIRQGEWKLWPDDLRARHALDLGKPHLPERSRQKRQQDQSDINDPRLRQSVSRPAEVPLFRYLDDAGERHTVGSTEVNAYLHEITGEEITAKDFRNRVRT